MVYTVEQGHCHGGDLLDGQDLLVMMFLLRENFDGVRVFEKRLQAVPLSHEQNILGNNGVKERILRRIEPWIRRELQAILGDTDPSIIIHVVASVYISFLELRVHTASPQLDMGDNFLAPLLPFLLDRTNMFWHELR
nr:uncharacterized protein LOC107426882 isoform X2 [Ziziphus jujuba var. spinosa]XP_048321591.1 uncharacterized protein LOC107426882 isoform X2 [Ziziphus jujuba var. spinosa]